MLQNIRCFIVYIVITALGSFRKQGIVFSFFALENEVGRKQRVDEVINLASNH